MRILVCASEAPLPPLNGFRLQLRPVCAELAKRHEVAVLAYRWPEQHGEPPLGVEMQTLDFPKPSTAQRAFTWLTASEPLRAVNDRGPIEALASDLIESCEFDVLHVVGWSLAGLRSSFPDLPAVLTTFDAWFVNYMAKSEVVTAPLRPFYRREARRIGHFERATYAGFESVVVVSDQDAGALRDLDPAIRLSILPNGVDALHFAPPSGVAREPGLVVFTGAMQWSPNARAASFLAREVMPLLRARRPDAKLAIVGRRPGPKVRALARLEGVDVTGEVPDVRDWLWRAEAFACPMLSGTGIKNKLLEAMACETPCVATALACQGMKVAHGRELLIAEDAGGIADAIATLLDGGEPARRLGARAREYVTERHGWESVAQAYERLFGDAIASRRSTSSR